jgi:phospholipid-transporting ATPase
MAPHRLVFVNNPERNKATDPPFVGNFVTTAKYNFLTFLPKFLYEQFSRSANLFFLFTACIQVCPLLPSPRD